MTKENLLQIMQVFIEVNKQSSYILDNANRLLTEDEPDQEDTDIFIYQLNKFKPLIQRMDEVIDFEIIQSEENKKLLKAIWEKSEEELKELGFGDTGS